MINGFKAIPHLAHGYGIIDLNMEVYDFKMCDTVYRMSRTRYSDILLYHLTNLVGLTDSDCICS